MSLACHFVAAPSFTLTPVIWSLIAPGLSAGRVQSVALSMVVERERARLKFKSAEYWDVVANVTAAGEPGKGERRRCKGQAGGTPGRQEARGL